MKIAILGTRGIPNYHGGFEQFAEFFSVFIADEDHEVYVYNSSTHPYQESKFKGANLIHCYDPEEKMGTVGQFVYDLNCIRDARKRKFDLILQLGYTSSSVWGWFLPKDSIVVTNMDGLEWKRSKYSKPVRRFLKYAEKLAVKTSDYLIADSIGIQEYIKITYERDSEYIAYGASLFKQPDPGVLAEYDVREGEYNMLIARMEPENNIETILDGAMLSEKKTPFLVIGKNDVNPFGRYLTDKFKNSHIRFCGGIYNLEHLNNLRYYSNLYFHGHSVGGTNPSLLEAMSSNAFIVANDNVFNKSILKNNALYFKSKSDVSNIIENTQKSDHPEFLVNNTKSIQNNYNWELINTKYLSYLLNCVSN
ncbi:MAG: DUF1972 domain-containing protein [Bacteroidia bacterium]|nr:DUF1972 domain-containing protein [Bacteroidia bacterium]